MLDATANAVVVWPEGIETLCSNSPTTCICALSTTAAGRGLSIKALPKRANATAKGTAHIHAHIKRGANTNKGAVSANTPQALPIRDKAAHTVSGHAMHSALIRMNRPGSICCNHNGAASTNIATGTPHSQGAMALALPKVADSAGGFCRFIGVYRCLSVSWSLGWG